MDWLSPFHLFLLVVVIALVMGPERAGRTAAKVVSWMRTYRQYQSSMTPTGLAQHLMDTLMAPPPTPPSSAPPKSDGQA